LMVHGAQKLGKRFTLSLSASHLEANIN